MSSGTPVEPKSDSMQSFQRDPGSKCALVAPCGVHCWVNGSTGLTSDSSSPAARNGAHVACTGRVSPALSGLQLQPSYSRSGNKAAGIDGDLHLTFADWDGSQLTPYSSNADSGWGGFAAGLVDHWTVERSTARG